MKTASFIIVFLSMIVWGHAQTIVLQEDFESAPYEVTSSGTPAWGINSRLQAAGSYSDSCTLGLSTTSYLTTNSFSTIGNTNVILEFKHICKIEMSDVAQIQYSVDGGSTWTTITATSYLGSGNFASNKFTEFSYATTWQAGTATAKPQNSWWKTEQFDLSSLVGNQANVRIRFLLNDANNTGPAQRPGWFLDDIKVTIAPSELIPPTITQVPYIWQDTVYQTGPFEIKAKISDASGIDTAYVIYSINAGAPDTLGMSILVADTFSVNLPAQGYNTRIDYRIEAIDASLAANMQTASPMWFYVKQAPPVVIIGTGTTQSYYLPCYGYYNYGWSAQVYSSTEIGTSGFIDSLFFYVGNSVSGFQMTSQLMKIGVVPDSVFADGSMPDSTGMTTFYSGSVTWTGPGWYKFVPSTPYYYSGSGHLLIYYFNNDGSYSSGYPIFNATNTTVANKAKYVYSDYYSDVFPVSTGIMTQTRPNLKLVFQLNNSVHDAALLEISQPLNSPTPITGTPYDVRVKIKNAGSDTLTSLTINWELNGLLQTPFTWNGSLLQDQMASNILIGTATFPVMGNNTIRVWTSAPDGFVDEQPMNDTLVRSYFACSTLLSGSYTIDPSTPTGGANFQYFSEVISALENCGISDTTVFNIVPGTYDTLISLGTIAGAGPSASVIFTSSTGNAASVILTDSAQSSSDNYIFDLSNVSYFEIRDLTLQQKGDHYGNCISMRNNCHDLKIEGNILEAKIAPYSTTDMSLIYNNGSSIDSNILIRHNHFENGSYSIHLYGDYSSLETNILVDSNTFSNYYYTAVYSQYQDGIVVSNNVMESNYTDNYAYAIYSGNSNSPVIESNRIEHSGYAGIYLEYTTGSSGDPGVVTNNFISVSGNGDRYGIYSYYCDYFDLYHNSINCTGTGSGYGASFYNYYSNSFNVKNNVLANSRGDYAIFATSAMSSCDYNNLYTTGTYVGSLYYNDYTDLASWQTGTLLDSHSVSLNPQFVSATDLHLISGTLNDLGTPVGVMYDIDHELRSLTTPDIGADEFTPPLQSASLIGHVAPVTGCSMGTENVEILIANIGMDTINGNLSASYVINNGTPVTEMVSTIIPPADTITYTFSTTVNMATGATDSLFAFESYIALTGDPIQSDDSTMFNVFSLHSPGSVTVSNATIPYGTSTTLTGTSADTVQWFADAALQNLLHTGATFTTPVLYDTTVYFVASTSAINYTYTFDSDLQGWSALTPCPSYTAYNWAWDDDNGAGAAFMINPYPSSSAVLQSPVLNVFGDEIMLTFKHKYETEDCCDRSYVAYRIDGGAWTHFTPTTGTYPDVSGLSVDPFFGSCNYSSVSLGTFGGSAPNYFISSGIIPLNGGTQLEIAFVASSDGSVNYDGWYIDSVALYKTGCPGTVVTDTVFITGIPATDIGVISIDEPNNGIEMTNSEPFEVRVKNFGTSPASNFTISYQVDGGPAVDETYTGTLNPGDTLSYPFNADVDLSAYATYNLKAYTTFTGDIYAVNDTAYKSVTNQMINYCACSATSTGYEDLTGLTIGTTAYTNPAVGAMYTDYTGLAPFVIAPGQTYPISVSSGFPPGYSYQYTCWTNVFIDYNHDGDWDDAGELVFGSSTTSSNTVSGSFSVPSSTYQGLTRVRVVLKEGGGQADTGPCGTYTWGETEDYMVMLIPPIPEDAGVISIVSPDFIQTQTAMVPVVVEVVNFGTDPLTSIPLEYIANGGAPVAYTWTGNLLPGDTIQVTMPDVLVMPDSNDICAYTLVPGDSNTFNDESCSYFVGLPPNIIFEDNMEDGTQFYTDAPTLWQHGVPTASIINTAHSPDSVWTTVLAGNYPNSATGFIYTPSINFAGITGAYLTFYYWMEAEENMDGGYAMYSTNNGATWSSLGSINDPAGFNWFDSYASGTPGWTKSTGGWTPAYIKLDMVSGYSTVKFRFGFKSNSSTVNNGFAIDDIKILAPAVPVDAGVIEIITPAGSTSPGVATQVSVRIQNFGTDTLNTIPVTYLLNTGFPPQNGTWTGTLLPDSTTTYTFTQTYPGPTSDYGLCAYTAVVGDPYKTNDSTCVDLLSGVGFDDPENSGVVLMQNVPNPASDMTEISFTLPAAGNCVITLRNTLGELIQTTQLSGQAGTNSFNINVDGLEQGIYIYTLEYKDVVLTRRFSVMR